MQVLLDDKYTKQEGRIYLNGTQAIVRAALIQKSIDKSMGRKTAGYVTGYRGSPLGGIDKEFTGAQKFLDEADIKFHPAVNEDLAATALWGSQQTNLFPGAKFDGVFGLWYGKGPGVDRSGDVFRHANLAGTSPYGGVVVLVGDDPGCKSSTVPSQSEYALIDAGIPILYPSTIQEIINFTILGWAMSRYSGLWVGLKCISDNIDTSGSVDADLSRIKILQPENHDWPTDGLHIRWPDSALEQERRLHDYKLRSATLFAEVNSINKIEINSSNSRLGIIASGKQYLDTVQALNDLGIDEPLAQKYGLSLYKVGMPWPLAETGIVNFVTDLDEVLVIEEKRPVVEIQIKDILYNMSVGKRPRIVGKFDEAGKKILPLSEELTPDLIARVIAHRVDFLRKSSYMKNQITMLDQKEKDQTQIATSVKRIPYFCSGCPHNTSTNVPTGSRAAAGIGCHYMAIWMDRETSTFTHMGAEGANWIGQAPFTDTKHIFVNIGDGTYFHSGILAIRAAVAANVNVTYKILYNHAVAMTGGQTMDGPLSVPIIVDQVLAEGARKIVIVSDQVDKYSSDIKLPKGVTLFDRNELDQVQRNLREEKGVSVLIYDQMCAAEKRRQRKRGNLVDPPERVFINSDVCEGCGDCGAVSNCVSLTPLDTELGRKRAIDQSSCNKDFSCLNGFCPSFVTVLGGKLRKPKVAEFQPFEALPCPTKVNFNETFSIVVAGIGGTGIVTLGALIGMAAHIEGKGVSVLDVAGLAQKNGAVFSHIRVSAKKSKLNAVRVPAGQADLVLGCDMVATAELDVLSRFRTGHTKAIINYNKVMTSDFTGNPDAEFPSQTIYNLINKASGTSETEFVEVTQTAVQLLGTSLASNIFLLGYACQRGLLPLSVEAIEEAIAVNGISVNLNKQAFLWGRRMAFNSNQVKKLLGAPKKLPERFNLKNFIQGRVAELEKYQNIRYAHRYLDFVMKIQNAEKQQVASSEVLTEAVARGLYRLMAYKDEYEVARLYTDGRFSANVAANFEPGSKLKFHLAPALISKRDPVTGHLKKREFGSWILILFFVLAKFKWLRGSKIDPFNYSSERKAERLLIKEYEALMSEILIALTPENLREATELANTVSQIRGFGHIKEANISLAKEDQKKLLKKFKNINEAKFQAAE